jgi:hypothetical protein
MKKYHENSQLVDSIVAAKDMNPHYIINMVHNLQKKNIYTYIFTCGSKHLQPQEKDTQYEFNPDCPASSLHYHAGGV